MACMSDNDEFPSRNFGESLQQDNWVLDSGATFHMTPQVSEFIPGLLDYMDKHIEVADGHYAMAKQKRQVQIKMCDNNGDTFITTLHNVLLSPDLCDRLFSIIALMNWVHTCLLRKGFCMVCFGSKQKKLITLPHSAQKKHTFLGEIKEMSKTKKLPSRKKIALELLHQILGHISTRSFLNGYNANIWEDV